METRIDETVTVRAPLAQAWAVLADLGAIVSCVPTARLVAGTDPGTVLARVAGCNASARVAARDDAARSLRGVGAARAASGPGSAAVSLTITARARSAETTEIRLVGDVELLEMGEAVVPPAAIRAFADALRHHVERHRAPMPATPSQAPTLAVPSLAATGLMPAYRPPARAPRLPTPPMSTPPLAGSPSSPPPTPRAAPPDAAAPAAPPVDGPARDPLAPVREWLESRRGPAKGD
jgi:carbon monoxide dehydrogenase subunit G